MLNRVVITDLLWLIHDRISQLVMAKLGRYEDIFETNDEEFADKNCVNWCEYPGCDRCELVANRALIVDGELSECELCSDYWCENHTTFDSCHWCSRCTRKWWFSD